MKMQEPDAAIRALRLRYANGELSDEQFRSMSALLEANPDPTSTSPSDARTPPLIDVLGLKIYDTHFSYANEKVNYPYVTYEEVISIIGTAMHSSINFIDRSNLSYYHIGLTENRIIPLISQKSYLGESIHKKIAQAVGFVLEKTFQFRLKRIVDKLKKNGELILSEGFNGPRISLTSDGKFISGNKSYDIAACAAHGVLFIGTTYSSLNGQSRAQRPSEIVIAEKKGFFGGAPRNALHYIPVVDVDVVHALIGSFSRRADLSCDING